MELPEAVKWKHTQSANPRRNKINFSKSIDLRPLGRRDTVVGKRSGKDAVVFSLLEKKTENYMAFLIPGKRAKLLWLPCRTILLSIFYRLRMS